MENIKQGDVRFVKYKKCLFPQSTGWDSIYIQDGISINYHATEDSESNDKLLAFKYVNANRILNDIKEDKFTFVSPSLWRDPFEQLFYKDSIEIDNNFYSVKCCCLAFNSFENEEGFWHFAPFSNLNEDNPTIRVSLDVIALYNSIEEFAVENKSYSFYIGCVKYVPTLELFNVDPNFRSIQDYIASLLLKREAFKHEMELRIFAVKKLNQYDGDNNPLLKIHVSKDVYHSVVLPPFEPKVGDSHVCERCYPQFLESSYPELKKNFEQEHVHVSFSRLYDVSYWKKRYNFNKNAIE